MVYKGKLTRGLSWTGERPTDGRQIPQRELAMRTAILYCGSLISNAFGPLVAAGIIGGMNNGQSPFVSIFSAEAALKILE